MDLPNLEELIKDNYISVRKHDLYDLYIYNYTAKTQYDNAWNETTLSCRGLILDGNGEVVARPFKKFFNLSEVEKVPDEPYEVFEKMDGSLGIIYHVDGLPYVATRGSFNSEQALVANFILYNEHDVSKLLKQDRTYLVEIIYPKNRIVVDYGDQRSLTLLAVIDKETGKDLPLEDVGLPLVSTYKFDWYRGNPQATANARPNTEGFVIKWESGFRVKVKSEEYVRLHRIISNLSSKAIWEALSQGEDLSKILETIPDEYYDWVRSLMDGFYERYHEIEEACINDYKQIRKQAAESIQNCEHPSVLFNMLDKKPYSDRIWKELEPEENEYFKHE